MSNISKYDFLGLRGKLYAAVGSLGTLAETCNNSELDDAYAYACQMLDQIDALGDRLGYLSENSIVKD